MRLVGTAFEFGMELDPDEEVFFGKLDGFHQTSVRGEAGKAQSGFFQRFPVLVGKFVAVAVAFADFRFAVAVGDDRILFQDTGIPAQAQGTALVNFIILPRHKVNDFVRGKKQNSFRVGNPKHQITQWQFIDPTKCSIGSRTKR